MAAPVAIAATMIPAGVLQAQEAGVSADDATDEGANDSGGDTRDGIILVTAQRRSESLQDVPISVTALTDEDLDAAGVINTTDLTQVTPGLVWARSTAFSQPTIRGIGSRNASIGDESNVAVYLDGIYQADQFATIFDLSDIERIEVLKGPQGTLFGRNATGGAVSIVTRRPSFSPRGKVSASYGSFGYYKLAGYVSGPIIEDRLAASVTALHTDDDGYIRNVYLDTMQGSRESTLVRGKLLFEASPTFDIGLNATWGETNDNTTFSHHPLDGNTVVRRLANPDNIPLDILIPTGDYETSTQFIPFAKASILMVDGYVDADLGEVDLSVTGSFQHNKSDVLSDSDGSPLSVARIADQKDTRTYMAEALLSSANDGPFQWVLGSNVLRAKAFQNLDVNGGFRRVGQKTKSLSFFGEGTFEAVPNLYLTAGLRYTYDKKSSFYQSPPDTGAITSSDTSSNTLTPRAVIRYEFSPDSSVYASYSRGYKSATFNPLTPAGALSPARQETVDAYELGVKSRLGDYATLNLAAYHYDYQDLQVTVVTTAGTGTAFLTALQNADVAKVDGLEANLDFHPTPNLSINFGVSYLHTKIEDFPNAVVTVPNFDAQGQPVGNSNVARDVSGNELIRAPGFTLNTGLNYTIPLGDSDLVFAANALFSGKYYVDLLNRLEQPAHEQVNASVTWRLPRTGFSVSGFVQNLTDSRVNSQIFTSTVSDNIVYQKPRWYGVTIAYSFGN